MTRPTECLTNAAKYINEHGEPSATLVLIAHFTTEGMGGMAFADRPPEAFSSSAAFVFLENMVNLADKAEFCPCRQCARMRAKLDLIKQIINPN